MPCYIVLYEIPPMRAVLTARQYAGDKLAAEMAFQEVNPKAKVLDVDEEDADRNPRSIVRMAESTIYEILKPYCNLQKGERCQELRLSLALHRRGRLFVKYAVGTDTITYGFKHIKIDTYMQQVRIAKALEKVIELPILMQALTVWLRDGRAPEIMATWVPRTKV